MLGLALAVLGGLVLLAWSAERLVHGAAASARLLGVSPLAIGVVVVGFGTSAPEILVSATAALQGRPGLAVGNALGSNIANIGLVLGASALLRPFVLRSGLLRREFPLLFAVMVLALILLADGELGRGDGLLLLAAAGLVVYWMLALGRQQHGRDPLLGEEGPDAAPAMPLAAAIGWTLLGLVLLVVAARLLVWGAAGIAAALGVSDLVIGLTVVAIGTSLPELAAAFGSVLKRQPDIAIGNVIGSNMFNLLAVLGTPALIRPFAVEPGVLGRDFPIMFGFTVALFAMAYGFGGRGRISRPAAALLLAGYVAYLAGLVYTQTGP